MCITKFVWNFITALMILIVLIKFQEVLYSIDNISIQVFQVLSSATIIFPGQCHFFQIFVVILSFSFKIRVLSFSIRRKTASSQCRRWRRHISKFWIAHAVVNIVAYGAYKVDEPRRHRLVESDARFDGDRKSFEERNGCRWYRCSRYKASTPCFRRTGHRSQTVDR